MNRLSFTIDGVFFSRSLVPVLEKLLAYAEAGRITLATSGRTYDARHQSSNFHDVRPLLSRMRHLAPPDHSLSGDEHRVSIHGTCYDETPYTASFGTSTFDDLNKLCRQLYGMPLFRLKPYQESRAISLYEHLLSDSDWFVTCDTARILGKHGQGVLRHWSINACSPNQSLGIAESCL